MAPDMDYLDKLRLTRVFIITQKDLAKDQFDQDCWAVLLHLVEHTISEIEFHRLFEGVWTWMQNGLLNSHCPRSEQQEIRWEVINRSMVR